MKKYLYGSWIVIKNYLFALIFFFIFYLGFYSKASLYSILIFLIMFLLMYNDMVKLAGKDKRKYGFVRFYDGALYALLGIIPFVILQIIISLLKINNEIIDFNVLKGSLLKVFVAPMLFAAKLLHYSVWGYALAWALLILIGFVGYFSGYKGFDLYEYIRKLFGLEPRHMKRRK